MDSCIVKNCKNKKSKRNYCNRHYLQYIRYGRILIRTKFDKNKIIDCNKYYEICLYNIKNEEIARTKIDKKHIDNIKKYKWHINGRGYVASKDKNKKRIFLHRLIVGHKKDMVTDHINGDKLDNRTKNLRVITQHQNTMNSKKPLSNTSGIKGVRLRKDTNKWVAEIKFKYKSMALGSFSNKEDAIKARLKAEKKYFKEYRYKKNE